MADKEFELEDPFQPVAVSLATPGYDGLEAMARCFVEEFAMMGWPPERVFRLFTVPDFAGSYSVFQERGEGYVKDLIASVFGQPFEVSDAEESIHLTPVLKRAGKEGEADGSGI